MVVAAVVTAWWSRNLWFHSDVWDALAMRQIGDVGDLLRPHHGHWQTIQIVQTRFLYAIAGMDFWPVHYLPRMIGWALLSIGLWWLARRRGAHPVVALGGLGVISFLGTSWYFHAAHIGALVAVACILAVAVLIETTPRPGPRHQVLLFGLCLIGVMSAGMGVAALIAFPLALLVLRRLRLWLIPLVGVFAIYGTWFLHYHVGSDPNAAAVRSAAQIPWAVVDDVQHTLANLSGLPDVAGWPLLVATVAAVIWLAWRRAFTVVDVVTAITALVYLVLLARTREGLDRDSVATNLGLLFAPGVMAHLRPTRRWVVAATGVALSVFAILNAFRLASGLEQRVAQVSDSRTVVESMAALIARGEPYPKGLTLSELTFSEQLTLGGLAHLVDDGWDPGPPRAESEATIRLRVSFTGEAPADAPPPTVLDHRVHTDGCVVARDGEPIVLRVTGLTSAEASIKPRRNLDVVWQWGDEEGHATLVRARRFRRDLYMFGPRGGATVTLSAPGSRKLEVCGVVAAESP